MRPIVLVLLLVALIAPAAADAPDTLTVTFLDTNGGDAILIQTPNGHAMLVDTGNGTPVSAGLAAEGVTKLEYVVATHGDGDHIGGLVGVMKRVTVGQFVTNSIPVETGTGTKLQAYLAAHTISTRVVSSGDTLALDPANVTVTVLNPQADPGTDWNEASVVLRLVYGTQAFMLTGDAGTIAEGRILASGLPVASTVLKVGHHGSSASTGEAFVAAVDPQIAVISVQRNNTHRLPSEYTVQRLQDSGAQVYSTASSGTVRVTATRTGCTVDTEDGPELPILVPTPVPTTAATPAPTETPGPPRSIVPAPPVAVQPVPVAQAVPAPQARPTAAIGKRYAVGSPGSLIGTRSGSGRTSTETGAPQAVIAPAATYKPGDQAYGPAPVNKQFVRWSPAGRWKAGIR